MDILLRALLYPLDITGNKIILILVSFGSVFLSLISFLGFECFIYMCFEFDFLG